MKSKIINDIGKYTVVMLGFSIPVSTGLNNVLLVLMAPLWFAGRDFQNKLSVIRDNKYVWSILILIGLYFAGLFYGVANIKEAAKEFAKLANLLLIPVMIPFFKDEGTRKNALNIFLLTMTILLFLSYLLWLGLLPKNEFIRGSQIHPVIFLERITHSLFMAFSAFICAVRARQSGNWKTKLLFIALVILFVFNVTVMVGGKTGYIVLVILTIYYFSSWLGWKGFLPAALAILIFGIFTYLNPLSDMHKRGKEFTEEISESNMMNLHSQENMESSTGSRITYYKNTLQIIIKNPLIGVGTGGYPKAYSQIIKDTQMPGTVNPHNEYLMVTSQLGLLGLFAFLFMFFMQWRLASDLYSKDDETVARGLVLAILSASLVSSTLIDHHERTFYIWMSALLFGGYMSYRRREGNKEIAVNRLADE